jgi:hypothetical protein
VDDPEAAARSAIDAEHAGHVLRQLLDAAQGLNGSSP